MKIKDMIRIKKRIGFCILLILMISLISGCIEENNSTPVSIIIPSPTLIPSSTPIPTSFPTPTPLPTPLKYIPSPERLNECEELIFERTNSERKKYGLYELTFDPNLANIARRHSLDMAQNNFFSHVNLNGEDSTARAIRYGYNIHKELGGGWYSEGIAENIGKMPTGNVIGMGYVSHDPNDIATAQVKSWMQSMGHRENILNSDYSRIGVGVAYDGTYYIFTQDFY